METVERDYSPQGVKFFYLYQALAHPGTNGYVAPLTLEERLMHVAEAKKQLGTRFTWLCDTMSNDLKHALGDAPNSEFLIGPEGHFVQARRWSRPEELREDLAALLGRVDRPTTIAELNMKRLEPPRRAATGVVARAELPGRMVPVQVQPIADSTDGLFYVKLRAEVEPQYFDSGAGTLYLGFFLDPLYEVHWNNRVMPVRYEIEAVGGVAVTPTVGKGPDVEIDADADPREFLVDLCELPADFSGQTGHQIKLSVQYFACDDAETFCKPVTQHYLITLQRDPDGGSRRAGRGGRFGRGMFGSSGRVGLGGFGPRGGPRSR